MNFLANLLFPPSCLLCGKPEKWLCKDCSQKLLRLKYQICPFCFRSSLSGAAHAGCQKRSGLNGLYSVFAYQKETKRLLLNYKFQMAKVLTPALADLLSKKIKEEKNLLSFWQRKNFILIPLPLHPLREKWRGFNQSALVGKRLAQGLNLGWETDFLTRIVLTSPQVGLGKKERLKKIRNQFGANRRVKKKNIIIFDDVWTTGATLKEAGRTLKEKGAKNVWGLTFCR